MSGIQNSLRKVATIFLGLVGAVVFWAIGMPLPFLFGPLVFCLVAALARLPISSPQFLGKIMRTVLGVAIGASITPEVVDQLPQMAASLALVPLSVIVTALIGVPFFRRVFGFDGVTAWYASMPGGLQEMVTFGEEAGANVRALTLIHATRLLLIVLIAPVVLTQMFEADLDRPIGELAANLPIQEMALMAFAAIAGWQIAERVGMFGASILGPMLLAAALSLGGFLTHRPPAEAILTAQMFIGIALGAGYVGVTLAEIRRVVAAGFIFVVIVAGIATVFAETVILLGLAPPQDGFLAFAPAGQAEMAVIAIVVGADLGYVVIHHLSRVFLVIVGAPIAARLLGVERHKATKKAEQERGQE